MFNPRFNAYFCDHCKDTNCDDEISFLVDNPNDKRKTLRVCIDCVYIYIWEMIKKEYEKKSLVIPKRLAREIDFEDLMDTCDCFEDEYDENSIEDEKELQTLREIKKRGEEIKKERIIGEDY